jgi:hypothetical protein
VELRLQTLRINGLVGLINEAVNKGYYETQDIDSLIHRYGWSSREEHEVTIISKHRWFFDEVIQCLGEHFPWNCWEEIVKIKRNNPIHMMAIQQAMKVTLNKFGKGQGSLSYFLAVFKSTVSEMEQQASTMSKLTAKSDKQKVVEQKNISAESVKNWSEIVDKI